MGTASKNKIKDSPDLIEQFNERWNEVFSHNIQYHKTTKEQPATLSNIHQAGLLFMGPADVPDNMKPLQNQLLEEYLKPVNDGRCIL